MLDALKKSVSGWAAKIFVALLVLSFAVWGIADIFGGYGRRVIASVGDTDVGVEEFRVAFQNEMQRLGQQSGRAIGLDEARAAGLHSQVLGNLVAEATLDNLSAQMGLGVSQDAIARDIVEDRIFRDSLGGFSRAAYEQFLAYSGLSEAEYVNQRRFQRLRRQLASAVTAGINAPQPLTDAFNRFTNETRIVNYVVLSSDILEPFADADDATLRTYFEDNKAQYRAPEYRHIELLVVRPEDLVAGIDIPEEDLRDEYEFRKDSLGVPEKRDIDQLVFETEAEARAAITEIQGGKTFAEIAESNGLSEDDMSLGLVQREDIVDEAIREAAFSLNENETSEPVEGLLSWVLLRVNKIEPASIPTFEDIRPSLQAELASGRAEERVLDILDIVEDDRAAGLTFAEIAQKNDIPWRVIPAIDRTGRTTDGEAVPGVLQQADVLSVSFEIDPGVETDPIQLLGGGYQWVNVVEIIDERERTFEEVSARLLTDWRADQVGQKLRERSTELIEAVNNGRTLESIASQLGTDVKSSAAMKRNDSIEGFSRELVQSIFATPANRAASSTHANGTDRVLFKVANVSVPEIEPDNEEIQQMAASIETSIADDLLTAFVRAKQAEYGVSINERALNVAIGLETPDGPSGY